MRAGLELTESRRRIARRRPAFEETRQIDRVRPLVKELIAAGMFLDNEFVDRVLGSVGNESNS
jgi:hypothetical protein